MMVLKTHPCQFKADVAMHLTIDDIQHSCKSKCWRYSHTTLIGSNDPEGDETILHYEWKDERSSSEETFYTSQLVPVTDSTQFYQQTLVDTSTIYERTVSLKYTSRKRQLTLHNERRN